MRTYRQEVPLDLTGLDLSRRILELGPGAGQLEAPVLAAGGTWTAVDKDPRAGVILLDYRLDPDGLPAEGFGGVYSRGSIGLLWPSLPQLIDAIWNRMEDDAWAWLSLWHGEAKLDPVEPNRSATRQEIAHVGAWLSEYGFRHSGSPLPNQVLFTYGLP